MRSNHALSQNRSDPNRPDRREVFNFVNKVFSDAVDRAVAMLRAQAVNIIVWGAIALLIVAFVVANRSTKATIFARLTSPDASIQLDEVRSLANSRDLAEALTDTEDPNSPATSAANVRSNAIREQAATQLNSLISAGKVSPQVAMDNLLLLGKDSDYTVKTIAWTGLSIVAGKSAENLKALVGKLSDGDPDVRTAAAKALGQVGGSQTAALVAPLLTNAAATDAAQAALTNIGQPSVSYVCPMLAGASPDLRAEIVNTLGSIGDLSGIPALLAQVNAPPPSPTVHRLAIIALADTILKSVPEKVSRPVPGAAAATPPKPLTADQVKLAESTTSTFVTTLSNPSEDSFARARSALALGRLGGPAAIASLVDSLNDFDSRVARASLTGIQQVGPSAVPALETAARNESLKERIAATWALGGIGDSTALAAIRQSLSDPAPDVRLAAAASLGTSANPDAAPLLIPMLGDTNGLVASAASNSLHLLGGPAIPLLVSTLDSSNQGAAFYASSALRQIGDQAVPAIERAVGSSSDSQKIWCAVTLGQIHDNAARPALTALAASTSPRVRWAANEALLELGQA
jgi:HEAT repeat protein